MMLPFQGFGTNDRPLYTPCKFCKHFQPAELTCAAFPEGIPVEIATGKNFHTEPVEGDGGIQFEMMDFAVEGGDRE